jgi:hypothetical protein
MSVVVQMEMPNGCHDCKLRNMIGNCPIPMFDGLDEEKIYTLAECFQRPPWCPIICSLPKEHGRLIDQDSLEIEECAGCTNRNHKYINCMDCAIANAPTIVPAERKKV